MSRVAPPLSEARRDVLYVVRRQGEATADDVAGRLGITRSGARQHLTALTGLGLVTGRDVSAGRGRPHRRYRVTDAAEDVFPRAYGELTNELLGYLEPERREHLFDRRRDQRIANAHTRLAGREGPDRVAELSRILDEDGYMATWSRNDDGSFFLVERNCAIAAVAAAHPAACRSEIEFIRAVLPGHQVERIDHIATGDPQCGYRISVAA